MKAAVAALFLSAQALAGGLGGSGPLGGPVAASYVTTQPYVNTQPYVTSATVRSYAAPQVFQQPQLLNIEQPEFLATGPQFATTAQTQFLTSQPQFLDFPAQSQLLPTQPQFLATGPQFREVPAVFQPPAVVGPGGPGGLPGKHKAKKGAVVVQPQGYITESTEERVFREPLSKTVTELPTSVTRIRKNIVQHYPMIHQRVQNHVTIEDEAVQNVIHHYYEPVDRYLGVQEGQKFVSEAVVDHPGEMYVQGEEMMEVMPQKQIIMQQQQGLPDDFKALGEEAIRPYISASSSTMGDLSSPYQTTQTRTINQRNSYSPFASEPTGQNYQMYETFEPTGQNYQTYETFEPVESLPSYETYNDQYTYGYR